MSWLKEADDGHDDEQDGNDGDDGCDTPRDARPGQRGGNLLTLLTRTVIELVPHCHDIPFYFAMGAVGPFGSWAVRYKLICLCLYGLVAEVSSKSYASLCWLLGSHFIGVCPQPFSGFGSYVSSVRVYCLRGTPGDKDVDSRV